MARKEPQDDVPDGLVHNPFAALRPGGAAPVDDTVESEPEADRAPTAKGSRLVVQREKRGRAGKTVTRVRGLEAGQDDVARRMKKALGCGAAVEDGDVILQGSLTERAAQWLRRELDVAVTVGN